MKSAIQSFVVLLATLLMLAGSAFGQWKPQKPVEIIVGTGAGGGQDKTARTAGRLLTEQRLVEPAVNIVNKPGGGGAVGWAYLNQHAGDAHYVEIANTTLLTNPRATSLVTQRDVAIVFATVILPCASAHDGYLRRASRSPV